MKAGAARARPNPLAHPHRIRGRLLRWYDEHRRDLPWRRRGRDAYAQWVAEIMLQQTRVETVIPYYRRFLRRFPSVTKLAEADLDEVLKYWQGLGYYRRILHLHQAARIIRDGNGHIPDRAEELRKLPGIGPYVSAAIASIAFGRSEAAVDGNVVRVISRLCGIDGHRPATRRLAQVRQAAETLLSPRRPGDFNQAWMDLGSLVCTPRTPRCDQCPLSDFCVAYRMRNFATSGNRTDRRRKALPIVRLVVGVFVKCGRVLVRKRPPGGLWSGLWEFPSATADAAQRELRILRQLAASSGLAFENRPVPLGAFRHQLSHRLLVLEPFVADVVREGTSRNERPFRWVTEREFEEDISVSAAHRAVFRRYQSSGDFEETKQGWRAAESGPCGGRAARIECAYDD
jgi:A/G-specific adenine glycosylase